MSEYNDNAIYKSKHPGLTLDQAIDIALEYNPENGEVGQVPKKASDGSIEWGEADGSKFTLFDIQNATLAEVDAIVESGKIPYGYETDWDQIYYYVLVEAYPGDRYIFYSGDSLWYLNTDGLSQNNIFEDTGNKLTFNISPQSWQSATKYPSARAVSDLVKNDMKYVTNPVEGNVLVSNTTGQAIDSGYGLEEVSVIDIVTLIDTTPNDSQSPTAKAVKNYVDLKSIDITIDNNTLIIE